MSTPETITINRAALEAIVRETVRATLDACGATKRRKVDPMIVEPAEDITAEPGSVRDLLSTTDPVEYGRHLRELIRRAGLTLRGFGEILDVTRMTVSRWALGRSYPAKRYQMDIIGFFEAELEPGTAAEPAEPTEEKEDEEA